MKQQIIAVQRALGIEPDGIAGPNTWNAIAKRLAPIIVPPKPSGMTISATGESELEDAEGFRARKYADTSGHWAIGIGHLIKTDEHFAEPMRRDTAIQLMRNDLAPIQVAINKLVHVPLTQGQFDALCLFTFNFNPAKLAISTLLEKLNAGDYTGAAKEFRRWNKGKNPQTGKQEVVPGLVNRRAREERIFNS